MQPVRWDERQSLPDRLTRRERAGRMCRRPDRHLAGPCARGTEQEIRNLLPAHLHQAGESNSFALMEIQCQPGDTLTAEITDADDRLSAKTLRRRRVELAEREAEDVGHKLVLDERPLH